MSARLVGLYVVMALIAGALAGFLYASLRSPEPRTVPVIEVDELPSNPVDERDRPRHGSGPGSTSTESTGGGDDAPAGSPGQPPPGDRSDGGGGQAPPGDGPGGAEPALPPPPAPAGEDDSGEDDTDEADDDSDAGGEDDGSADGDDDGDVSDG